jgi:uncharacterized protein (DUF427 family)
MTTDQTNAPTLETSVSDVVVAFNNVTIAETRRAIMVHESGHPACWYIPPEDVRVEYLQRIPKTTECPWKGSAHYYNIEVDGRTAELAAWCYADPKPDMSAIKHYIAFYPAKVDSCTVDGRAAKPEAEPYYGGWSFD